ncbi:toprim domain-containing protein, partial [Enterococcus innesii]
MNIYKIVKKHLDEAETIVIATDSDREGEAIA